MRRWRIDTNGLRYRYALEPDLPILAFSKTWSRQVKRHPCLSASMSYHSLRS